MIQFTPCSPWTPSAIPKIGHSLLFDCIHSSYFVHHPVVRLLFAGTSARHGSVLLHEACCSPSLATTLMNQSFFGSTQAALQNCAKSECRLDALDVVLSPVPLRNLLLTDWHTIPLHTHHSDVVDIVLIKLNVEGRIVTLGPLAQSPALYKLLGCIQLLVFS